MTWEGQGSGRHHPAHIDTAGGLGRQSSSHTEAFVICSGSSAGQHRRKLPVTYGNIRRVLETSRTVPQGEKLTTEWKIVASIENSALVYLFIY